MAIPIERLADLASSTWEQRLARGTEVEKHFSETALKLGYHAVEQRPMIRDSVFVRHFPDIILAELPTIYWQVKDGRRSEEFDMVLSEIASFNACRELSKREPHVQVCIMWEMPDGKFRGNFIDRLVVTGVISDEARERGSRTAAYKIRKSNLDSIENVIEQARSGTPAQTKFPWITD